jgi:predicted MPP superfamily phosphohydrolase
MTEIRGTSQVDREVIRILHVSDLHFRNENFDQNIVVSSFLKDIAILQNQRPIDVIVFSGDLVQCGDSEDEFAAVVTKFLQPMLLSCNLARDRIILVPGNHDISRPSVEANSYAEKGFLAAFNSIESVNRFVDEVMRGVVSTIPAFERLARYTEFERTFRSLKPLSDYPLYQTYDMSIRGIKLGFGCFNTAWRCTGAPDDADKGHLLLGERCVDSAVRDLEAADIRLAVFHHPIDYLASFEQAAVEGRLLSGFDLLLYGHVHSDNPTVKQSSLGKALYSQSGCLYQQRSYHNGYQVIDIGPSDRCGKIIGRTYFDRPREFRPAVDVLNSNGEMDFELAWRDEHFSDIEKFLIRVRPTIRERANRQVTITLDPSAPLDDINQVFVCPPISKGGGIEKVISGQVGLTSEPSLGQILESEDNFVISGHRESGKSSLAHLISLKVAEGNADAPRVPIVLEGKSLKTGRYNFERAAHAYLSKDGLIPNDAIRTISNNDVIRAIATMPLLIVIDDFDETHPDHQKFLVEIATGAKRRIICFIREYAKPPAQEELRKLPTANYSRVRLESLPRNAIRTLAAKRGAADGDPGEAFSGVMSSLISTHLPWNGYIVSLLLWAQAQNKRFERLNEAVLIQSIVDFLLEKGEFSSAFRGGFDARSKEITLQALAGLFSSRGDYILEEEIYDFLFKFFKQKGLKFSAPETIVQLTSTGILSNSDGMIAFRFRCFQEYFYACALREDAELFAQASSQENIAKFAREFDLLTSITRKSSGLLDITLDWLQSVKPNGSTSGPKSLDEVTLLGSGRLGLSPSRRRALAKTPLDTDKIDDMMGRAEQAALKKRQERRNDMIKNNHNDMDARKLNEYYIAVELLGRIVRNSEFDDLDNKIPALEFYLEFSEYNICLFLGFIQDILNVINNNQDILVEHITSNDLEHITNILRVIFPIGVCSMIREQAGSEKLIPTLEFLLDQRTRSFGIKFLICALLLDLGASNSVRRIFDLAKSYQLDPFKITLIHEKLCANYDIRLYRDFQKLELENAIADIEVISGKDPKLKGAIIANRRKITDAKEATSIVGG